MSRVHTDYEFIDLRKKFITNNLFSVDNIGNELQSIWLNVNNDAKFHQTAEAQTLISIFYLHWLYRLGVDVYAKQLEDLNSDETLWVMGRVLQVCVRMAQATGVKAEKFLHLSSLYYQMVVCLREHYDKIAKPAAAEQKLLINEERDLEAPFYSSSSSTYVVYSATYDPYPDPYWWQGYSADTRHRHDPLIRITSPTYFNGPELDGEAWGYIIRFQVELIKAEIGLVREVIPEAVRFLEPVARQAGEVALRMGETGVRAIRSGIDAAQPLLEDIKEHAVDAGHRVAETGQSLVEQAHHGLSHCCSTMGDALKECGSGIAHGAQDCCSGVGQGFGDCCTGVGRGLSDCLGGIGQCTSNCGTGIWDCFSGCCSGFGDCLSGCGGVISSCNCNCNCNCGDGGGELCGGCFTVCGAGIMYCASLCCGSSDSGSSNSSGGNNGGGGDGVHHSLGQHSVVKSSAAHASAFFAPTWGTLLTGAYALILGTPAAYSNLRSAARILGLGEEKQKPTRSRDRGASAKDLIGASMLGTALFVTGWFIPFGGPHTALAFGVAGAHLGQRASQYQRKAKESQTYGGSRKPAKYMVTYAVLKELFKDQSYIEQAGASITARQTCYEKMLRGVLDQIEPGHSALDGRSRSEFLAAQERLDMIGIVIQGCARAAFFEKSEVLKTHGLSGGVRGLARSYRGLFGGYRARTPRGEDVAAVIKQLHQGKIAPAQQFYMT